MRDEHIIMYGADWCHDCKRARQLFDSLGVRYQFVDIEADPSQAQVAQQISGSTRIPVVVYQDGSHQVEPGNDQLESKLRELEAL